MVALFAPTLIDRMFLAIVTVLLKLLCDNFDVLVKNILIVQNSMHENALCLNNNRYKISRYSLRKRLTEMASAIPTSLPAWSAC